MSRMQYWFVFPNMNQEFTRTSWEWCNFEKLWHIDVVFSYETGWNKHKSECKHIGWDPRMEPQDTPMLKCLDEEE